MVTRVLLLRIWSYIHSKFNPQVEPKQFIPLQIKFHLTFNTTQLQAIITNGIPAPLLLNHILLLFPFNQTNDQQLQREWVQ